MQQITSTKRIVENDKISLHIIGESIFHLLYHKDQLLEKHDFETNLKLYNSYLDKNGPMCVLHEFQFGVSATLEARKFGQSIPLNAKAEAFVFSALPQRLLLRFHVLTSKNNYPIRVFAQKDKALEWLQSQT